VAVHEVREFLLRFKRAVTAGSGVFIVQRASTRETLVKLSLTEANLEEVLLALSIRDYCSGPEPDRDRDGHSPGQVWIFGKRIHDHDVYIKLKVFSDGSCDHAKCLSFHIAERPLAYPHRQ